MNVTVAASRPEERQDAERESWASARLMSASPVRTGLAAGTTTDQ